MNYKVWGDIISFAKELEIDRVSFLPADLTSEAFNRPEGWSYERQSDLLIPVSELPVLKETIRDLFVEHRQNFENGMIAETPEKIIAIYQYYCAANGLASYPVRRCNAPWVSAVIEADGNVRPCFFHAVSGNIHEDRLPQILNGKKAMRFRKELDVASNDTCKKCVCSLHLPASVNPASL